ncbi:MAG: PTS sugar transporter subunit IIA [Candidatus Aminicenantes bacterium]|nr:PTS sugar transporter subunit IIA [Candidatus Aminicenantes bacterium]
MIKGLIITHGSLGKELIQVAETILEKKTDVEYICLDWTEDGSKMLNKVETYLKKNEGSHVLIFTDMFGGTPTNISYKFNRKNVEVITGINLSGLLKFLTHRRNSANFKEIVRLTKQGAIDDINIISEYLGEKKS